VGETGYPKPVLLLESLVAKGNPDSYRYKKLALIAVANKLLNQVYGV
jgi:hypothetical protein